MSDPDPEVLSQSVNLPVIRMPGRKYPGVLIQGDTLSSLYTLSQMICRRTEHSEDTELTELSEELASELARILTEYERVLKCKGYNLPYVSPFAGRTST